MCAIIMTTSENNTPITETTAYLLGRLAERQETQGKQLVAMRTDLDVLQTDIKGMNETLIRVEEKVDAHSREHAEGTTGRRWLIRVGLIGAGIVATLAIQLLPEIIRILQANP